MEIYDFKQEVEEKLLQLRYAHRVSKNQIALRCMFCGDSKKDPRKTRFYVYINHNDDSPMLYNCFNCQASGILTPKVLRTFDINDLSLNSELTTFNNTISKQVKKSLKVKLDRLDLKVPLPKNTKLNVMKKHYIEDRLGIKLTIDDLQRFKVIFSLEDFLKLNKIENVTCKPNRARRLNDDYVGFLSSGNEYIIYRDITGMNKLRYDKYRVIEDNIDPKKFYTIPTSIDIMSTEPIIINMAEGVFDILGVYYHVKKQNDNEIYVAICDSEYASVIKYFIGTGLIGPNIIINIFSDSDHEPYFYKHMIDELSIWVGKINLFYNSKSKDYGVTSEMIELYRG